MSRLRLHCVLLATLTLLLGLHVLRVFLPTVIWYLGQYLDAEGLALYALLTFALTLLVPVVRRWLGERGALTLTVGGLALVRLIIQVVRAPLADLILATVGTGLLGWFVPLWHQSPRNCPSSSQGPALVVAFPLAFSLDTGSRSLLLSYDLAWRRGWGATVVVVGLAGLTLVLLWRVLKERSEEKAAREPALGDVLPLIGLGPWLYVTMSVTHNPPVLMAATGWGDVPAHLAVNGFTVLGAVVCLGVASWPALQRWRWALLGGGLVVVALALLIAGVGPGWLWLGLASFNSWAALGEILASTARTGALRPGLWRTGVAVFLALVIMLATVVLVTEYDMLWMTPVAGLVLAMAAVWGTRVKAGRDGGALGKVGLVGSAAVGVLLAVGVWVSLSPPPQCVEMPPTDRPLRVMTYNIHHGIDADLRMDLEAVADVIAAENPDVIVLNEVNRARATNGFVDTLPLISRRLRMPLVFGANYQDGQYGNALLSRYPVLAWDNTHYTHNSTEIRGLLRAVVQTSGEPITFYITHLDHLSGPDNVRAGQVAQVLAEWAGDSRAILLGDLNAEPDAPELQPIYQAGFVDVLGATGQDDAFTYWDPVSSRRIDFIFLTPDLPLGRAWVVPSRASDHLPVLAEVGP